MTYTGKDVPDHARDIDERLTKTFVRLRFAKVKQILEMNGESYRLKHSRKARQ